jgi:hypothetical protein
MAAHAPENSMSNDLASFYETGPVIGPLSRMSPFAGHDKMKLDKSKGSSGKSPKRDGEKEDAAGQAGTPKQRPPNPKPNWRGKPN